jgi:hypothetical protein
VSQAIARALSKQPEQRFLNAAEFAVALGGWPAPSDAPVVRRATTRRRVLLAVAAAAVLASAAWLITRAGKSGVDATTLLALRTAADSGRLDQLAFLADSAGIPADHRSLRGLGVVVTGFLTIATEPSGVEVDLSRVGPIETFAGRPFRAVGRTPIQNRGRVLDQARRAGPAASVCARPRRSRRDGDRGGLASSGGQLDERVRPCGGGSVSRRRRGRAVPRRAARSDQ